MAEMYIKYRGDDPVAYAYGDPWVAQALFMDDIGYPTPEEAIEAWKRGKNVNNLKPCISIPGLYDQEEIIEGCTVQILTNSVTRETSVGWWKGDNKMKWISVDERLPENEDRVLCCTSTKSGAKNIVLGYFMDGMWRCGMNSNVTHWMPLPDLPTGG